MLSSEVPEWERDGTRSLRREFSFQDFRDAFGFVARAALIAEAEGHHPDIELGWGRASFRLIAEGVWRAPASRSQVDGDRLGRFHPSGVRYEELAQSLDLSHVKRRSQRGQTASIIALGSQQQGPDSALGRLVDGGAQVGEQIR